KVDSKKMKTFSAILQSVLVGCTAIMLVSAWFRMVLYEEAYGFTYLRVLTQAFMVFLLILAAVMVVKIWRTEISFFKPFVAIALASFILVNYINIDLIIVRSNIKRFNETGKIDVAYIGNLSYDAVPELVDLLESLNGESRLKALRILRDKKMYISGLNSWQSFNVSRAKAGMHLGRLQMEEAFKTLELWEKEQSGSNMGTDRAQEPYETWTD
ncbi:MAG: DUF4173 domain-containing protein, partial [Clostridiales bacterium]|nr:DUF4173 domain-containing protein [Clostridiales bacterium]